jgi:thioredoxin reductase (NADPH)
MPQTHRTKVLILGSGPAGYTAAVYAARANLKPILVRGLQPGGQLSITTEVENYPGFAEAIQGPWLMEQMAKQAEHVGTQLIEDTIVEVDLGTRPFVCTGDSGDTYVGETLIICTGAQARWLELPSETKFRGYGVSACATCDGFFFRNKRVAVVGGGNTAVEEALYLTNHASHVTLVHRRDSLRADKTNQARLFANPKIDVVWNTVVDEVLGDDEPANVTGLKLRNIVNGAGSKLAVDGLFVAIGHDPATALFKGQVDMDAEGYIVTRPDSTATNIPGVFAAGDVKDKVFRQAVTAAGMGCMGALEAERFLAHHAAPALVAAQ